MCNQVKIKAGLTTEGRVSEKSPFVIFSCGIQKPVLGQVIFVNIFVFSVTVFFQDVCLEAYTLLSLLINQHVESALGRVPHFPFSL